MPGRLRDPPLFLALLTSLALALTAWTRPLPAAQLALAAVGGLWAPGYAAVAVAYPRGRLVGLERHALALGAGILILPLAGLAAGELLGFRMGTIAGALFALTALLAAIAWRRPGAAAEAPVRSTMPSTRATFAIAAACLVAATSIVAVSLQPDGVPASLALSAADGGPAPARWEADAAPTLAIEALAGTQAATGALVVTWDGAQILSREIALDARASERITFVPPADGAGPHTLEARWDGRVVRAHVVVGSAA